MSVASHQSAVGVLGDTELFSTLLSTHVVVLGLGDELAIVHAFLVFGGVRLVELVDDYIALESVRALTESPSDFRFAPNFLNSIFTSH